MNSRNPLGKGYKAALTQKNENYWHPFLAGAVTYLSKVTITDGKPLHSTQRKTPFIGFIIAIVSVEGIFEYLIVQKKWLKYLLTYKLSQDHLELFFCAVRSCGGWNNNPTAMQFASAYRRLLVRHHVEASNGNYAMQDKTAILHVTRDSIKSLNKDMDLDISDVSSQRCSSHMDSYNVLSEHDYSITPDFIQLSRYVENVVGYIAGYVVKMIAKEIRCETCLSALLADDDDNAKNYALLNLKNRGGLKKTSQHVIAVCDATEKFVRHLMNMCDGKLPKGNIILEAYQYVLKSVNDKNVFSCLHDHMFDSSTECNHVHLLVRHICKCYFNIRMYHIGKQQTALISGHKIRKELSKLILFKHQ